MKITIKKNICENRIVFFTTRLRHIRKSTMSPVSLITKKPKHINYSRRDDESHDDSQYPEPNSIFSFHLLLDGIGLADKNARLLFQRCSTIVQFGQPIFTLQDGSGCFFGHVNHIVELRTHFLDTLIRHFVSGVYYSVK